MPPAASADLPLAQRLLDAQVAHHLARLDDAHLAATVTALAEDLFAAGEGHQLADLVDQDRIASIVERALADVPASAAVGGILEMVTTVLHEGPSDPSPLSELVDRAHLEELLDQLLALHPVLERALERLTESPAVGTLASRFMGRVVGEVMAANKAVAGKVPGLGTLMSFGTSAATKVVGAADKQFEGLIGDTMGKGGTFAVRRLNRIVLDTLRDPTTREAALQVWDLLAPDPVPALSEYVTREELDGVVDAAHSLAVGTLAHEDAARLGEELVAAFFERFGGYSPTELLTELDLDRDALIEDLVVLAPGIVGALRASGDLERIVRAQLEPFWSSPEVRDLLG